MDNVASLPNKELIRVYILLPAAINVVHQSLQQIKSAGPVKTLFIKASEVMHDRLVLDFADVSRELRRRGFSVESGPKAATHSVYRIRRNGAERAIQLPATTAQSETAAIISNYMMQLEQVLERRHA
ncbi:MAG: hypothetical protein J7639_19520 [Paenibacillaceae bacterium]|nr:hypothetical protein [Paenibacillaceae bacterium]